MARRNPPISLTPLTIAIVAVATPATLALSFSMATGDTRWRPLGQTIESSWFVPGERKPLTITVYWPTTMSNEGGDAMAQYVLQAIKAKGIHAMVSVRPTGGHGNIVYKVGASTIGPFALSDAAYGVNGAVDAYWSQPSLSERADAI